MLCVEYQFRVMSTSYKMLGYGHSKSLTDRFWGFYSCHVNHSHQIIRQRIHFITHARAYPHPPTHTHPHTHTNTLVHFPKVWSSNSIPRKSHVDSRVHFSLFFIVFSKWLLRANNVHGANLSVFIMKIQFIFIDGLAYLHF